MLKIKTEDKDGRPIYLMGLSPMNMQVLKKGDPISFDGNAIGAPPGHWFLIAYVRDAADLKRHHDHFAVPGKHNHTIGIDRSAWESLSKGDLVRMPGTRMQLDGDIVLVCGVDTHQIAAAVGIDVAPLPSGYRDELDPVTGQVVRKPEDKSS